MVGHAETAGHRGGETAGHVETAEHRGGEMAGHTETAEHRHGERAEGGLRHSEQPLHSGCPGEVGSSGHLTNRWSPGEADWQPWVLTPGSRPSPATGKVNNSRRAQYLLHKPRLSCL